MGDRVLDWNALVRIAELRNPADRVIAVAGIPARVVPHRGTDVGFYVRTNAEASDRLDGYWSLRKEQELVLLRALVDAGRVTVADDQQPELCPACGQQTAPISLERTTERG